MIDVKTATTAELVAFYNKNAEKPVTKFADRKTAERRVATLIDIIQRQEPAAPKKKSSTTKPERSAAIAETWKDKNVAARRSARHHVLVAPPKGSPTEYKSVRQAFMVLALPLGQHIKFRSALKAAGQAEFGGFKFKLVDNEK